MNIQFELTHDELARKYPEWLEKGLWLEYYGKRVTHIDLSGVTTEDNYFSWYYVNDDHLQMKMRDDVLLKLKKNAGIDIDNG